MSESPVPPHWPDAVRDIYDEVEATLPADGAAHATLVSACELLAIAYALDELVAREGLMLTGSTGQPVLNGAVSESRLARTAALASLSKLIAPKTRTAKMTAGKHGGIR